MSSRSFTCIVCPNGCEIKAEYEENKIIHIQGNKCKKGKQYVEQELIDPRRTIATSVPIEHSIIPMCSVRLTKAISKKHIFSVMEEINKITLEAPVCIGEIVIAHVCGLDSDVIVTKNMERV